MAKRDVAAPRRGGSREAIVDAAEHLFLEHGFGGVSMDDLAEAAGVARRTLYNQFPGKEEIFREMLGRVSRGLGDALPPGIETRGDVEEVLRLMARALLTFQARPQFVGIVRLVAAEAGQFPWIAEAFWSVLQPQEERFERYLTHLTTLGVLDCPDPRLAASQFLGLLNEPLLWPRVLGRDRVGTPPDAVVVEEAVRLFLLGYRRPHASGHKP
jgi:TetR/AcrR family transcriptional regulator, regulator of autoinduction and epiphytic fitness